MFVFQALPYRLQKIPLAQPLSNHCECQQSTLMTESRFIGQSPCLPATKDLFPEEKKKDLNNYVNLSVAKGAAVAWDFKIMIFFFFKESD